MNIEKMGVYTTTTLCYSFTGFALTKKSHLCPPYVQDTAENYAMLFFLYFPHSESKERFAADLTNIIQ